MIRIEPLGLGGRVLPGLLVGFELSSDDNPVVDALDDAPPWLLVIGQQAGGMCMRYPSVVGALFRLEANSDHAFRDVRPLIRGFQLMAEDPQVGILKRDYPLLTELVQTWGEKYSSEEIWRLNKLLERYFYTPKLHDGIEAFVRSTPCNPLDYYSGWRVFTAKLQPNREHRIVYRGARAFHVEASNLEDVVLGDDVIFGNEHAQALAHISTTLPSKPALRTYLMWENCD